MSGPDSQRGSAVARGHRGVLPLMVSVLGVAGVVCWLVLRRGGPETPGFLGGPLGAAAAALACHQLAGTATAPKAVRDFWRRFTQAAMSVGVGALAWLMLGTGLPGISPGVAVPMLGAVSFALLGFAQLPFGRRSPLRWWQVVVDCATVVMGGLLIFAYGTLNPTPDGATVLTVTAAAGVGVGGLLAVVVIGKAAMTPGGPVDGTALRLLTAAPLMGVVGSVLLMIGDEPTRLAMSVLASPLVALSICAAVAQQHRALRRPAEQRRREKGRSVYDLLPVVVVAAITALLMVVSAREMASAERNLVMGAVVIAALVIARQLLSVRDNQLLVRDIRRQQAQLEYQAHHDPLTGLANRTAFGAALTERLGARHRAGVLVIDIDDFKMVNDTMGHTVGDQLLSEVAQRLRSCVTSAELLARLGADEFAVLLEDGDRSRAEQAADRILQALAVPVPVGEHHLLAHASIGIALGGPGDDADEVLRNADIAMYTAKDAGKASWMRFEPHMRQEAVNHARLGSELHDAIRRGELYLLYQPVFDIVAGRLSGVEALVRWQHPERGPVSPGEFIPVAERTGLIVPLGAWVLREACEQLARWNAAYGADVMSGVNVNVAARQLRDPHFVDLVAAVLSDTGLRPHQLVLEVTESSVLEGRQVRETCQALHDMGVRLALDDFGTGASSLSLLRAFPVDVLKLDKSFVDGICDGEDRGRLAVATAVAQLTETLGLYAVAEGIENEEQMVRLRELGYRFGQGFHMARPLPPGEVADLVERARRAVPA